MSSVKTPTHTEGQPTRADRIRQIVVIVGSVVAIVGAFLGSGAAGGTTVQDAGGGAFAADATLLSPGTTAFSIWSVIYTGLVAYAIWQAFPRNAASARHRSIGWWVLVSMLLNAVWILVVQAGLVPLSLLVIVALLAVLVKIFITLQQIPGRGIVEAIVVDGTLGLYLGWVMIATVANVASVLVAADFDGFGISPDLWGVVILIVAGAISVALSFWGRGRLTPALATAWGVFWIGVARTTDEPASTTVGTTAFIVAGVILLAALVFRASTLRQVPEA